MCFLNKRKPPFSLLKTFQKPTTLVSFSLFVGFGVALYFLESSFFPALPLPGAKLGLAHLATFFFLPLFTTGAVLLGVLFRILLGSLITGTFLLPPFYLSLAAGFTSTLVMVVVYRLFYGRLSFVGVSLAGAFIHNITQVLVAAYLLATFTLFAYLPFLLLIGLVTGTINGLVANYLVTYTPRFNL
jgi:heptaprenyl diphosphate synthase